MTKLSETSNSTLVVFRAYINIIGPSDETYQMTVFQTTCPYAEVAPIIALLKTNNKYLAFHYTVHDFISKE